MAKIKIRNVLFFIVLFILAFELFRDAGKSGDFIGYVNAGNLVLSGGYIYSDYLNTWPPLFSICSVPLALGEEISPYLIRFFWLLGSVVALFYIYKIAAKLLFNRNISLGLKSNQKLRFNQWLLLAPLLIILRFVMDNLSNIQINLFLLLGAMGVIHYFIKGQDWKAGLLLGLIISLKVFPVFLLFYFIFKRSVKPAFWTLFFMFLFNGVSIMVFGWEQSIQLYSDWVTEVAPRSYIANHKNQSVFGAFLRLFTNLDPDHNLYTNLFSWSPDRVKNFTYLAVAFFALFPAWKYRKSITNRGSFKNVQQYILVLSVMPLLSPVSWKAYFIFLLVPYLLVYSVLYHSNNKLKKRTEQTLKVFLWLSVGLNVLSADLFLGPWLSDVFEAYSAITLGTVILVLTQFILSLCLSRDFALSKPMDSGGNLKLPQ